jgi:tetratricopeptide (TPR) repeat protein
LALNNYNQMDNYFIDPALASENSLACAALIAERIGSADGHATAVSDIALRYAAKGELDLAAGLADTIHDPHTRDTILAEIAARCVEFNDDEYGLQLVEAIEDYGFQQQALSSLAVRQAEQGKIDEALQISNNLDDSSLALAEIAIRLMRNNDEFRAREILEQIEFQTARVQVLNEFAAIKIQRNESAVLFLSESLTAVEAVEFSEERIQLLLETATRFFDAKLNDKAFEVLQRVEQLAETLDERFSDQALMQTSLLYARAGDFERAERVLKLIVDLQNTATAHAGIAHEYQSSGDSEKASNSLEEAYATLRSQPERQIRDSRARFNLFANIAVRFAQAGKFERALEIALENPAEEPRYLALSQIAAICAANGNEDLARQAVNSIKDLASRQNALILVSDAERRNDADKSLQTLNESYALTEEVGQLPLRSSALNEIAIRFAELGARERAAEISRESLQVIQTIADATNQSIALANTAEIYEKLDLELAGAERDILHLIVRRRA